MEIWIWIVLLGAASVAVASVWWKRRARRVYVIDHVQVEMHRACVVEDRVVEVVWRAAISMTNTSRRPRTLPVFAERATVRAGRRTFVACVYLDVNQSEINPGEVALAWVEGILPSASAIQRVELIELRRAGHTRSLRWGGMRHAPAPAQLVH